MTLTSHRSLALTLLLACGAAHAASGSFSTLSYNVAGLPQGASSAQGSRSTATRQISCYVKKYDLVNVQEDFNYHADLYDACDDHPFRSPTSGGAGVGSGLNTLSRFPYDDWARVKWNDCNGVDCLTPKGFTMARTRLAEGVYVDIYNLHAQAQTETADLAARRKNIAQLLAYIESESAGNAVVVLGDTNTRYTRDGDNIGQFLRHGFTDAWVERTRNGSVPAAGAAVLLCEPAVTSANCEIVDKVFYRGNGHITLSPTAYAIQTDATDANGTELSDHRPISTNWNWSTATDRRLSDSFGGPHGTSFNDVSLLPAAPAVRQLKIRSGSRMDRVEVVLSSGAPFAHGGSGGNEQALTLASGEVLKSVSLCSGQSDGRTRIFSASFTTSAHRTLSGGTTTSACTTYSAPDGWAIVGFHGRAGDELDKLGVVYAPAASNTGAAAAPVKVVNAKSGLCMDISQARTADGSNVLQWTCSGGANQTWSYDAVSGLVRSMLDPHYCLDNSGTYDDGGDIVLWHCNGSANQRFSLDAGSGRFTMRTYPTQAVDGIGSTAGGDIKTFRDSGATDQRWKLVP